MKTRFFILGAIFAIMGFGAKAQVNIMYEQGFEVEDPVNYTVTPSTGSAFSTNLYMGGSQAIKLIQAKNDDIIFETDTIDFRQNLSLRYITLEFDHICNVVVNTNTDGSTDPNICLLYVKLAYESDLSYRMLTGTMNYDTDREGFSEEFRGTSTFNKESYTEWQESTITNSCWKNERFKIDNLLTSDVPAEERRVIFRFVLKRRTRSGNVTGTGWWLDNIRVRSSMNQMVDPKINMVLYPDGGAHPSSRGARVVMDARTDVAQGINNDSAYLYYTIGSDLTPIRLPMAYTGNYTGHDNLTYSRFAARIPFCGYDTMMRFYCVVRDATVNANMATYPQSADTWVHYWCTRGTEYAPTNTPAALAGTTTASDIPFIQFADTRFEWVIDSAYMANAGYGPGAMTSMRFTIAGNTTAHSRPKYQFRLKNVPNSYTVNPDMEYQPYMREYMQVVWDSTLVFTEAATGAPLTINFQDTFFYAGSGILMQTINDGETNPPSVTIKMVTNDNSRKTKGFWGKQAVYHANAYTDDELKTSSYLDNKRPALVMSVYKNQPLQYDAGIDSLVFPNYETPIVTQPSYLAAQLTNFGDDTINSVDIHYSIDDSITGVYTWNGTLPGHSSTTVTVANGITLAPGYHEWVAWTDDSLTAGGFRFRDHEPLNNSSKLNNPQDTSFIVCAGPLSGIIHIGGPTPDYRNIDEFLFSLSRCGINDSLVVRISPDSCYKTFSMPEVDGLTEQHYIVFEADGAGYATIYADATTNTPYIANLANAGNIKFRNINFVRRGGELSYMVALGENSDNCSFDSCNFLDSVTATSANMRITALLHSGFSDNLAVRNCTFVGGGIGIDLTGQAVDMRATGGTVEHCYFSGQYTNAVRAQYMNNVVVEHNEMYNVTSNSSYVLLAYACYGNVRLMANKIYSSHGAGALGASNVNGTSANHAIIANNMIVSADDGNSNLLTTALNVISGSWMDVVYNSVKMTAPQRNNIATATFGGGVITNSMFVNNIVACYDNVNYAFSLGTSAQSQSSNTLGHNIYYSESYALNRMGTQSYHTIEQWTAAVTNDATSISLNPTFLNGSLVDLRTFNRFVKGTGTPVASVTTDMFDTVRNAQHPCPGAFEFVSLNYDFEPEALVNPEARVCGMPENVELVVRLRNSGSSAFVPNATRTMAINYSVNGGTASTYNVTQTIPANDTVTIHTGHMLQMPCNGLNDSLYNVRVWFTCASDPNQTNDTNSFAVLSCYQQPDANDFTQQVPYATAATVRPTSGILEWDIYNNANAPKGRSQIMWYRSPNDENYYYRGDSVTTEVLRRDTTLYFKQRRLLPMVRITQVQMKTNNAQGLTDPMPAWIKAGNNNFAVQLTNIGDDTAYLQGDTLRTVSGTPSINDKKMIFGDVRIAPGKALVVQFVAGTATDPHTVYSGVNATPSANANLGLVYAHNGVVVDAVAFNSVTTANVWTQQHVPSYVWTGSGVLNASSTVGGYVRTGFNGNASDWRIALNSSRMFIDTIDNSWIRYIDNGCPTGFAEAHLVMLAPPSVDLELSPLPLSSGCGLGMEPVSVLVNNYGMQPATNITLNYTAGGAVVSETLTTPLAAGGDTIYTFQQPLNMSVMHDSVFTVKVYATQHSGDSQTANDTCTTTGTSLFQPGMPTMSSPVSINYGESATLTHNPGAGLASVWYDSDGNILDTADTYVTPLLYVDDTMLLGYVSAVASSAHVGTLASITPKQGYPSPYQPNNKFVKQQYLYTAHELRTMGLTAGNIESIAFHLDSIWGTVQSVSYDNYYISLGLTADTVFANSSAWKATQMVYHAEGLTLTRANVHQWVNHQLDGSFVWDGESSLVVQVVFEKAATVTTGMQTAYTTKASTTLYKNNNSALSPSTMGFVGAGTLGNNRPDIIINAVKYGCAGPLETIAINIIGTPAYDAKIMWPTGTDDIIYNSCGNIAMDVNVSNLGSNTINSYELRYSIDGGNYVSSARTDVIAPGATTTVQLMSIPLMPGRHQLTAVVVLNGDTIQTNDTIHRDFMVRFCGRTYTISATGTADYSTITEAVDTLNIVGVDGPVVFSLAAGTYNEQVVLNNFYGSSNTNTITFLGESDSTTFIIGTSNIGTANYVFSVDGASNVIFRNLAIISRPASGNYGHVLLFKDASNITLDSVYVCSKGTISNTNASGIVIDGTVTNLTIRASVVDSGYYSIVTNTTAVGANGFTLQNSTFQNFFLGAMYFKDVTNLNITKNTIESSRKNKMTGIYLENVVGDIYIQKNKIYLIGVLTNNSATDKNGRRGIDMKNVAGTALQNGYVVNNMISLVSDGVSSLVPIGINVDGTSSYLNIYYNTVRLYAGATDVSSSKAFAATAQTDHLQVMNNIFSNFSGAYAYHVAGNSSLTSSDYNDYYAAGAKFAYWDAADRNTLTDLQLANGKDGSSLREEPYFEAENDLHLAMANLVARAQYNPDVTDDIDDSVRAPVPGPTIGAHEMFRRTRNMSVMRILTPTRPLDTANFSNTNMPPNIESDSILVKAEFYNNGSITETQASWYAYIEDYDSLTTTAPKSLGTMLTGELKVDSVYVFAPLGVINTHTIRIVLTCPSDDDTTDNQLVGQVYLAPAFDLMATKVINGASGCTLQETQVSIELKNNGFKPIPTGMSFEIGYHAAAYYPNANNENNRLNIPTIPDTVREVITFNTPLPIGQPRTIVFDSLGNFYPTDTILNIKVRLKGWCRYPYDVKTNNDTTANNNNASPVFDAFYSPYPPVGFDTTFDYGSWGEVRARQANNRPIRWHRDSTEAYFYTASSYANSCWWRTTPQYFHDSTYYLQCFSDKSCPSYFSEVHVHVRPQVANDIAIVDVLAPLGDRVYMENDTVCVRIANYGTNVQQNFPVTYQLRKNNNTAPLMEVTETCTALLDVGQTITFTFDSLLQFATPLTAGNYFLRVWTDLAGDAVRRNDTIRYVDQMRPAAPNNTALDYPFHTLPENTYPNATNTLDPPSDSIDIVRISYNSIDVELPALGRAYTNFGNYSNPEYPVLHVTRGTTDSILVAIANPSNLLDRDRGRVMVYVDFNRNGAFDDPGECVVTPRVVFTDSVMRAAFTIPQSASLGYMKMRVSACRYSTSVSSYLPGTSWGEWGHVVDFLLFVDPAAPATDVALTQIVSPRSYLVRDSVPATISFRMANKGSSPVTNAHIYYRFDSDSMRVGDTGDFAWTGVLMPGRSTVVSLPAHVFPCGTTTLKVWHSLAGDVEPSNDTLRYEYHRFHTVYLTMEEDFDSLDLWYAPTGYNNYTHNYWQRGTPNKASVSYFFAFSEPNSWVTDLTANITSGVRGNVSYLYSPIIDISQIRPDTLSFYLVRNLLQNSNVTLEYYSYRNKWEKLYADSLITWYNNTDDQIFDGTNGWRQYSISTTVLRGNFNERLQFRFVYTTPQTSNANANFGAGCAIDDFRIVRGRQRYDVGVVAITKPVNPKYGQTIYPEVIVKNYGTDTVRQIQIGYTYYGTHLARMTDLACNIPPYGGRDTFAFDAPFIVSNDFPDTFSIVAFTNLSSVDIYRDNDTLEKQFVLAPLGGDIAATDFIYPLDNVVAGDSITVTMRIRNFGENPIDTAHLTYIVGNKRVDEDVSMVEILGRPLATREYFNYTFHERFRASMGSMAISAIAKCDSNDYVYNDTIAKRIKGISAITDVAAAAVVVDTSDYNWVRIQLVIENRGSRGVNNFEVGFWYDNDTTTKIVETFYRESPLEALNMTTHLFDVQLPQRSAGYHNVTAYVYVPGDNDRSNDTTSELAVQFVDIEVLSVLVEENANPDCRVFIRLRNIGNLALTGKTIPLRATINGNNISYNVVRRIDPGYTTTIEFTRTVPKSPTRTYVGTGRIQNLGADVNPANNQTSNVIVVNYVEGIPTVNGAQLVLGQNYPNPFTGTTAVPFTLPSASDVHFFVMDAMGKIVYTDKGFFHEGDNVYTLDLGDYATGIYYYGIVVDGQRQMRKLIVK